MFSILYTLNAICEVESDERLNEIIVCYNMW